jgi:hypothetical protein
MIGIWLNVKKNGAEALGGAKALAAQRAGRACLLLTGPGGINIATKRVISLGLDEPSLSPGDRALTSTVSSRLEQNGE